MKEEILFCIHCFLKFDKKVWFDLHLSLVHEQGNKTEFLEKETKKEPEEIEYPIHSSSSSTNSKQEQDLNSIRVKQNNLHQKKEANKCTICNAIFTRKTNLKTHIASVHEGKF